MTEPTSVQRDEQPYLGARESITMTEFGTVANRLPELFGWLATHGIAAAGAPFFRYRVIDMANELVVEAGVPVPEPVDALLDDAGTLFADVLPAGRYATVSHIGHPDELLEVTRELLEWADRENVTWDMTPSADGEVWGCRVEFYRTNPAEVPDMTKWENELAFRLAD